MKALALAAVSIMLGSALAAESAPVTLHAGDTFYETPGDVHVTSANASSSAPAKFLVYMVKNKGVPPSTPVTGITPGG